MSRRADRPDVRPSEIHRHDNRLLGTFHHGIVERDRACPLEGFQVEPEEVEICCLRGDGILAGLQKVGFETGDFIMRTREGSRKMPLFQA